MSQSFDELIKDMPGIAKAVNAFTSPDVQKTALVAILRARGTQVDDVANDDDVDTEDTVETKKRTKKRASAKTRKRLTSVDGDGGKTTRRRSSTAPARVHDLNLRPKSKQSLPDFITEKSPSNNYEKCLVTVYWMREFGGVATISKDHVFTCFKDVGWRVPPDLNNTLQQVASKKGWLNTSDMDDIAISVSGENYVVHDMPAKTKKSKAA